MTLRRAWITGRLINLVELILVSRRPCRLGRPTRLPLAVAGRDSGVRIPGRAHPTRPYRPTGMDSPSQANGRAIGGSPDRRRRDVHMADRGDDRNSGVEHRRHGWDRAVYIVPDLGLWLSAPLERRLSQKFVDQAASALARVDPIVVGITGSYGKTSTKWYVRDLVEGSRRVVASPASYNNRLGLARAVNEHLTPDAEVFIAEMGTYRRGEIADLCSWIPPEIAVLTAIGPVHLQRFRTEQRIVEAKSEIMKDARVVVLNVDHPLLAELADQVEASGGRPAVWRCGTTEAATDVRVRLDRGQADILVRGHKIGEAPSIEIFPANLSCAIAVAFELGVQPADLVARSRNITQTEHRQSIGALNQRLHHH